MSYAVRADPFTSSAVTGTTAGTTGTSGGLLSLPEFTYSPTEGLKGGVGTYLNDYYGQMANNYLPQVDQFATNNAGKMVAWDQNDYMTVQDFGLSNARGNLRTAVDPGYFIGDQWHSGTPKDIYQAIPGGRYESLTYLDDNGSTFTRPVADGAQLFTRTEDADRNRFIGDGETPQYNYTGLGEYRKSTEADAWAQMVARGGGHATGNPDGSADFGGELDSLTRSNSGKGKWGSDPVNIPELAPYINDPNWVQRSEDGKVTGMRAELLPYVFREEIGEMYRDIARGGTKSSDALGDIMGAVVLGVITWGIGTAAAGAMGLTGAAGSATGMTGALTGGAGLSTAGSIVSGGISGGLSAGMTGGDIGKGILTGGIGGGLGGYVSKGLAGTGVEWLDKGTIVNNALTRGTVGAATTLASGGDAGKAGTSFLAGAGSSAIMEGLAYNNLTTGVSVFDNAVGSILTQTIGGALNPAETSVTGTTSAKEEDTEEDTSDTKTTTTGYTPVYPGGRVNYVKR